MFDDISECTGISINVISNFFQNFITFGSDKFYIRNAQIPQTNKELEHSSSEHEIAGFAGACGSMDAANVVCDKMS